MLQYIFWGWFVCARKCVVASMVATPLLTVLVCIQILNIIFGYLGKSHVNVVWMSKNVLSSVCLFICKTKFKTLKEWTVSGPEGGIAITPVANTEYHLLLEGGGATGCGTDTKVELCKISEKYHFLIDQWHCINSLEICINYNISF